MGVGRPAGSAVLEINPLASWYQSAVVVTAKEISR